MNSRIGLHYRRGRGAWSEMRVVTHVESNIMDGWMDKWMDQQTDGRTDGWTDGQSLLNRDVEAVVRFQF